MRSASSSRIARMSGRFIRRAETVARPVGSNPRYELSPNESGLAIAGGAGGIERPCDRSSDRRRAVALPFVRSTRRRQGPGCRHESDPVTPWAQCGPRGNSPLGLPVTIHSIRIEHPHAARPSGAIERERHSFALRPPIADSFDPQPQERKQLSQIHQALSFLSLRCG